MDSADEQIKPQKLLWYGCWHGMHDMGIAKICLFQELLNNLKIDSFLSVYLS